MAVKRFGTRMVTGLNVGAAPHLIADHELAEDHGGWTDQDGTWRTAKGHLTVHTGSAISCMAVGRMKGQDHYVYLDGNTLKDLGSTVGTITMGSDPRIIPMDDKFLILGASDGRNRIYDGDHVRYHGAWQADYMSCQSEYGTALPASGWEAITAATAANPCVITVGAHNAQVGDRAYISGVGGMVELNDKQYKVVAVGATTISLDVDSSAFTAYTTGGYADFRTGFAGSYKWALAPTIELADGTILEGELRAIQVVPADVVASRVYPELGPDDRWDSEAVDIVADDYVWIGVDWSANSNDFKIFLTMGASTLWTATGTQGVDWIPGVRVYRTKDQGTDFYLLREYQQGDVGVSTFSDGTGSGLKFPQFWDSTPDIDLGAVYTADIGDHAPPPKSSLAAQVGQRLFVNNADYPKRVYISHLDGTDYFNELGWFPLPDHITAMRRVRDRLVCLSAKRIWVVDMISGFPVVSEVDTSHGTIYPDAMFTSEHGLFFVKDGGIYFFDLNEVVKVSRKGILDMNLSAGVAAAVSGEVAVFTTNDQAGTAMANVRDGSMVWHGDSLTYTHLAVNSTGAIIGCEPTKVDQLFASSTRAGSFTGKTFGDGLTYDLIKLYIDATIASGSSFTYEVTTNNGACWPGYQTATSTTSNRQIFKLALPRKACELWRLEIAASVDLQVHGYWFEVEG